MMRILIKILLVSAFGSLMTAQTDVSGVISTNTTWSSNVNITGNILVSSGVTLTIEPGVTVAFQGEYYIQVEGSLMADGNANSRITFTNNTGTTAGGYWKHIDFKSSSSGGSLTFCNILFGGRASYLISSSNSSTISIKHNIIEKFYFSGPGGTLLGISSSSIIQSNLFRMDNFNDNYTPTMDWKAISCSNCTVSKNIFIRDKITTYNVNGVYLSSSSTLQNNIFININQPIVLTDYGSSSAITNNLIINSQSDVIDINGSSSTITNNTIISNILANSDSTLNAISFDNTAMGSINPVINNNNILGFKRSIDVGLFRSYQTNLINAENNYWGTTVSSEISAQIYDYNDDFNLAEIDYDPFLTSPNTDAPISPPTGVSQTSSSGNYVISWSANPESDIAGYKVYYGGYTGYSFSNVKDVGNVTSYDMIAGGLASYSDSVVAVTAYDINKDGTDDQVEGYESWFSIVPYSGPVWYVSKSGSDDNDGSEDSPFITIQKGIDSASSGDTIRVGAHMIDLAPTSSYYYSKITITDKNLTILSDSGADSTKIDGVGTGRPVTITGTSAVTMKGFSITNGLSDNGGGINISSTGGVLLENLNVYGNQSSGGGGGIFIGSNIANTTINSCKIYNNECVGSGGGILNQDILIVQNSLIYNNEAQTDGGGISSRAPLILINSTLARNFIPDGRYGPALKIETGLDSLLLFNNIFDHNYFLVASQQHVGNALALDDGRLVAYNNYFQSGDNNLTISRGSGNIFSDVDPFNVPYYQDWSLNNASSAIGAGVSSATLNGITYSAPTTDYSGATRPQPVGTSPDMGAIENSLGVSAAKTIYVCPNTGMPECYNSDFEFIQSAIDAANDGDTILVYKYGVFFEHLAVYNKNLTIKANTTQYGETYATIDGQGTGRPITITGTSAVTLKGLSLKNGKDNVSSNSDGGGGIKVSSSGSVLLEYLDINNNQSDGNGGGVFVEANSIVTISSCKVRNNSAANDGGGLWIKSDDVIIQNTLVYGNSAQAAGGIFVNHDAGGMKLINSTITGNSGSSGAAIFIEIPDSILLVNNIFYNNGDDGLHLSDYPQPISGKIVAFNNYFSEVDGSGSLFISRGSNNIFSNSDPFGILWDTAVMEHDSIYTLVDYSSAIGSGIDTVTFNGSTYIAPLTDYNGDVRPQPAGSNPDMGAIENILGVAIAMPAIVVCGDIVDPVCMGMNNSYINIQPAINASEHGDTILVYPGTFYENINFNGKNIVVGSLYLTTQDTSYISSTIIDGNESGSVVTFESGETSMAVLSGFTIQNGSASYGGGISIDNNSQPNLTNLTIQNNTATGTHTSLGGGGIWIDNYSDVAISNVIISDNSSTNEGGGIYIKRSDPILTNILITNNSAGGWGGAISIYTLSNITLTNVTIVDNISNTDVGGIYILAYNDMIIKNSIISGNSSTQIKISSQPEIQNLSVSYSLIEDGQNGINDGGNMINWLEGNINSEPYFIDATNGNYHLLDYSPCIGAGTIDGVPITDLDSNPRPNPEGSNPDIGAYENALGVASVMPAIVVCINVADPACTVLNNDYQLFQNIPAAISAASNGDTILVYPGIYSGIIGIHKAITLKSVNGPESTILDATLTGTVVTIGIPDGPPENNVDATLDGFTLQNGLASGSNSKSGGLIVSVSNSIIKNCIIRDNQSAQGGGIYAEGGSFYNCVIINNTAEGEGGGVFLHDTDYGPEYYTTFTNCLIADNHCDIGAGISYGPTTLINCTVVNNTGEYGLYSVGASIVTNSIIYDNHGYIYSSTPIVTYSLIEGGYTGEGNIDLDPLLEYPQIPPMSSYSYTLQSSSPAIDAANPDLDGDGITWETDTDDQDPDGSRMDMGYTSRSCQVDQCGVCDHDTSNDCVMDCAGVWGGDAELDCTGVCEGGAILDDCGDCDGENENMNECGVCDALYSCNPFVLSNEKDTISLKVDTLTFTFSVPMDTLTFSAISLASTEIDNIEFHTSQDADSIRTLTLIINSPLVSRDTLTLTFPSTLQSSFGYPFDGNQDGATGDGQTITLYTETLADYNHDNAIDFDDMTTFIASWYADDYDKELGPVTGTAPHLIPAFDNAFDIEDIITFMLMWNWANDFIPTPSGRIKDSGIPPNIVLQDGILQLDLSEYLDNIAAVRIQLSTSDPQVKVVSEGIQSPFGITLLRSWEKDNIYEWNLGNPQGKHFDVVQLCHLETMQKQNLHLVIDYEIISTYGNVLSSGRTALDHIVVPNEYALQQAYPNPFNPVTTLSFGLPIETEVSLSVYNLQGKEVISLIDGNLDAGYHSVVWNADRHSSGVYFVKMIAGEYVNTQKLMLVK